MTLRSSGTTHWSFPMVLLQKILFPTSGVEVVRMTYPMRKNEYNSKTALLVIIYPIAVPFLAERRQNALR